MLLLCAYGMEKAQDLLQGRASSGYQRENVVSLGVYGVGFVNCRMVHTQYSLLSRSPIPTMLKDKHKDQQYTASVTHEVHEQSCWPLVFTFSRLDRLQGVFFRHRTDGVLCGQAFPVWLYANRYSALCALIACATTATMLYKRARLLNAIKRLDITKPGPGFTVALSAGGDRSRFKNRDLEKRQREHCLVMMSLTCSPTYTRALSRWVVEAVNRHAIMGKVAVGDVVLEVNGISAVSRKGIRSVIPPLPSLSLSLSVSVRLCLSLSVAISGSVEAESEDVQRSASW